MSGITNRGDLVAAAAQRAGLSQEVVDAAVTAFLTEIAVAVWRGDSVRIQGFASFDAVPANPRVGRNPRTGERVDVPAGRRVRVRVSGGFREVLRDGPGVLGGLPVTHRRPRAATRARTPDPWGHDKETR